MRADLRADDELADVMVEVVGEGVDIAGGFVMVMAVVTVAIWSLRTHGFGLVIGETGNYSRAHASRAELNIK